MVTRDDLFLAGADNGREYSLRFLSIFPLKGYLLEGEIIFTSDVDRRIYGGVALIAAGGDGRGDRLAGP
jgi:hypothetical protein